MEAVPNVSIGVLEKLGRFMVGRVLISVETITEAVELLQAARAYDVCQLEECCVSAVVAMLTSTQTTTADAIRVHDVATVLDIARLSAASGRRLKFAGSAVLENEALLHCALETVCNVLQLGILGVTPTDEFRTALRYWAAWHCGRGLDSLHWRKHRDRLFGAVHYELMDPTDLATFVRRSGIFSASEYIAILERVVIVNQNQRPMLHHD